MKSYPQRDAITKDGLKGAMQSAKSQHEQGDLLFINELGPAARLSTGWSKVNLLVLPNVKDRAALKEDHVKGLIDDTFLKYVLTKAELENELPTEQNKILSNNTLYAILRIRNWCLL